MKTYIYKLIMALCLIGSALIVYADDNKIGENPSTIIEQNKLEEMAAEAASIKASQIMEGKNYITEELKEKIQNDNSNITELLSIENVETPEGGETVSSRTNQYDRKRIFIFLSSSMPKEIIRSYIESAEGISNETQFIIRGFVDGIKKFKPTWQWVIDVLCDEYPAGSDQCLKASIDINPNLFEEFDVQKVPAVLFLPDGTTPCDKCSGIDDPSEKDGYLSYGDARLAYHLTNMSEMEGPHSEQISGLLKKMQNSFYYRQTEEKG